MKKLFFMLSLVLCLASCVNKESKDKDEENEYEITGKVSKDAQTLIDALADFAQDQDFDRADDFFAEVLKKYDNHYDIVELMEAAQPYADELKPKQRRAIEEFLYSDDYSGSKYPHMERFFDLLRTSESSSYDDYTDDYSAYVETPAEEWEMPAEEVVETEYYDYY